MNETAHFCSPDQDAHADAADGQRDVSDSKAAAHRR